jgi:hypothetical protein
MELEEGVAVWPDADAQTTRTRHQMARNGNDGSIQIS